MSHVLQAPMGQRQVAGPLLPPASASQRWCLCSGHHPQPAPRCGPASWGIVVTALSLRGFFTVLGFRMYHMNSC